MDSAMQQVHVHGTMVFVVVFPCGAVVNAEEESRDDAISNGGTKL